MVRIVNYGHTMVKFLILCGPNSNLNPKWIFRTEVDIKAYFCRNGWLMENMDKGLTVPKWVLINWPKLPQMPQKFCAQFVCPCPKVWDFNEKRLHRASVVPDRTSMELKRIPQTFFDLVLLSKRILRNLINPKHIGLGRRSQKISIPPKIKCSIRRKIELVKRSGRLRRFCIENTIK